MRWLAVRIKTRRRNAEICCCAIVSATGPTNVSLPIDDAVQGVTLVVRGQDLLPSTGRQIRLARLIGRRAPPVFAHHPLIMKSASQKLSKSDGDSGIADLRAAGWSAAQVIGCAAALAGLTSARADLRVEDLSRLFARASG